MSSVLLLLSVAYCLLIFLIPITSGCPARSICEVNICVLIADLQAGQTAYRKYASTIDTAISEANNVLPSNITLRKFYLPEIPTSSGRCITACAVTRALALLGAGVKCHVFLGPNTPNGVNSVYGVAYTNGIPMLSMAGYGISSRKSASLLTLMFLNTKDIAQFVVKYLAFRNYTYVAVLHDQSDEMFASLGAEFYTAFSEFYNRSNRSDSFGVTPMQFHKDLTSANELEISLNFARTKTRVIVIFTFLDVFKRILVGYRVFGKKT